MSASESLTGELEISLEDTLRQVQALNTANQGNINEEMPVALMLYITPILLIVIIYICLIDYLRFYSPNQSIDLAARLGVTESLSDELKIKTEDAEIEVKALKTADQGSPLVLKITFNCEWVMSSLGVCFSSH